MATSRLSPTRIAKEIHQKRATKNRNEMPRMSRHSSNGRIYKLLFRTFAQCRIHLGNAHKLDYLSRLRFLDFQFSPWQGLSKLDPALGFHYLCGDKPRLIW